MKRFCASLARMPTPHSGDPSRLPTSVPPEMRMFRRPWISSRRQRAPATFAPVRVAVPRSRRTSFFSLTPRIGLDAIDARREVEGVARPDGVHRRLEARVSSVRPSPLAPNHFTERSFGRRRGASARRHRRPARRSCRRCRSPARAGRNGRSRPSVARGGCGRRPRRRPASPAGAGREAARSCGTEAGDAASAPISGRASGGRRARASAARRGA